MNFTSQTRSTTPSPRRKDAIATRERLVRSALELFTSLGYRGTTTLDLAAKAATAEATIYRHFVGKESLFNEAYRQALTWGGSVLKASDPKQGARERLHRIGRRLVEQVPKDAPMVLMLVRHHDGATLEDGTHIQLREFREALTLVMAAGKQEGTVRPGSADLWAQVWLALVTFVVERVAAREWLPEQSSAQVTLEAAWDAIAYRSITGPG